MHHHGNNNNPGGHDSKMMWLMMLGCLLPVVFIGLAGGRSGRSSIWILLAVGGMLALHWFTMRKSGTHNHSDNTNTDATGNQPAATPTASQVVPNTQPAATNTKSEHKHGCC